MRLPLIALCLLCSAPAFAQERADSWQTTDAAVHATAAGISVPQQAGGLALVKTGEISGEGADIYAQYVSADNVVQATIFVYRPGFADTAVAALATERTLIERFGPATRRDVQQVTSAGGHDGVALRTLYSGAADGELVLAAGFVRSGDWIVKLRVTAPADRKADVEAGIDALLRGLSFDNPAALQRASLATWKDCTASASTASAAASASFPRNGADALCRAGVVKVADATFDMIQPAVPNASGSVLIPTDDAGGLLRFDRMAEGGFRMTRFGPGAVKSITRLAKLPDAEGIAAIISGGDQVAVAGADRRRKGTTALR
ncbi:MAG: hypothetical protein QHC67_07895 [Sphingobium sp.]|uniref:hypothetical protein n=1 Tax=Sphingobium sp. TaxID=1912891 RepID=UPI0029A640E7|nr:hypothetical protein [Sphingobium sp.]MDX3909727.1 hypothetical protein [Sphingobium sp.]